MSKVMQNDLAAKLSSKLADKNRELKEMETKYEKEIARLKEENRKILKHKVLLEKDSDESKEILRLNAHGYNVKNIYDILTTEKGMNLTIERVKITVDKIDLLPDEMYQYYLQCKQDFKEKVSIDSGFFTNAIYKKYMLLENTLSSQLARAEEAGDEKLISVCTGQLTTVYDKMSVAFAKNGMDMSDDRNIEDLMGDYSDTKEKATNILKFDKSMLKVM